MTTQISSRTADVAGVQLHYLTAGDGPQLILLHGFAETSAMWKPAIPALAERFTVIAPDLPGIGESSIPSDGVLGQQAKLISDDVTVNILKNTGHWVMEENPQETTAALLKFL